MARSRGAARPSLPSAAAPAGLLVQLLCASGAAGSIIAGEKERKACPHYQQMTCFLDVLEKGCESDEGPINELIQKETVESAWLCCCPLPYKACRQADMDSVCVAAYEKILTPMGKSSGEEAIREGLQKVRGELRLAGGTACEAMAPMEPLSPCGFQERQDRSIARGDLFCEMLTWQREELGDGNQEEFRKNRCPWPSRQGDNPNRKGNRFGDDAGEGHEET